MPASVAGRAASVPSHVEGDGAHTAQPRLHVAERHLEVAAHALRHAASERRMAATQRDSMAATRHGRAGRGSAPLRRELVSNQGASEPSKGSGSCFVHCPGMRQPRLPSGRGLEPCCSSTRAASKQRRKTMREEQQCPAARELQQQGLAPQNHARAPCTHRGGDGSRQALERQQVGRGDHDILPTHVQLVGLRHVPA